MPTPEQCAAEEAKTHRHLKRGEPTLAGDIYGGQDWGFVFTIGSRSVQKPRPGELCDPCIGYRIRRKK